MRLVLSDNLRGLSERICVLRAGDAYNSGDVGATQDVVDVPSSALQDSTVDRGTSGTLTASEARCTQPEKSHLPQPRPLALVLVL